jgi:hypothetical protein
MLSHFSHRTNPRRKSNMKPTLLVTCTILQSALILFLPGNAEAGGRFVSWQNARGTGSRQIQHSYSNGTYQRSAYTQFAGGRTASVNQTATRTGNGSVTTNGTYTGLYGRTLNNSATVQKTSNGRITNGSYSTNTGKSGTYSGVVTNSPGSRTKQQQLTTQSGATYSRQVNTTYGNDSLTRTVARTNPNGQSHGRTVTVQGD